MIDGFEEGYNEAYARSKVVFREMERKMNKQGFKTSAILAKMLLVIKRIEDGEDTETILEELEEEWLEPKVT